MNRTVWSAGHPAGRRRHPNSKSGTPDAESPSYSNVDTKGDHIMPYLLGWLLGVPLIVLVILYLIFH
ncbi:hypothetical protein G3A41_36090 [Paraburkholderia aspalathi]|nr:hypothetical protein [Paraburkholderia aspalathi]MBK3835478.1 hypothetical protein [Paraburkholderia aspalathi]MBK3843390.1 hypothetical protein [Paraburkholderia aspalathi]MBK3865251.1 hypothetical protein [Paraburkholderia aspalathi]